MELELVKISRSNGGSAAGVTTTAAAASSDDADTATVANGVGASAGEELEGVKKDLDRIMGRSGEETDEIEGVPSLVRLRQAHKMSCRKCQIRRKEALRTK